MSDAYKRVEELTAFGPRPATSGSERDGHEWFAGQCAQHGLAGEIQDFDTIRNGALPLSLLYIVASALVICSHFVVNIAPLRWLFVIALVAVVVALVMEYQGRGVLDIVLPKGPSQNVVARFTPHSQRGEKTRKVILVSHMDTPLISPLNTEATAELYAKLRMISAYFLIVATGILAFMAFNFKFMAALNLWIWILLAPVAIVPAVLGFDALFTVLAKRQTVGANDSASGIAVLLGVLDRISSGKGGDLGSYSATTTFAAVNGGADYSPNDVLWSVDDELGDIAKQATDFDTESSWGSDVGEMPIKPGYLQFETVEFGAVGTGTSSSTAGTSSTSSYPSTSYGSFNYDSTFADDDEDSASSEVLGADIIGTGSVDSDFEVEKTHTRSWSLPFGSRKERKRGKDSGRPSASPAPDGDASDWLGLDDTFDARSAGREIGTWDNFGSEPTGGNDSDDGWTWKGGRAGGDFAGDGDYVMSETSRISRKVTQSGASDMLDGKEIWFVATGARHARANGMKVFLDSLPVDVRDAMIINVESVGSESLSWYAKEGDPLPVAASGRLVTAVKRASRELDIRIQSSAIASGITDATPALQSRKKAVTVTRTLSSGFPEAYLAADDTIEACVPEALDETVDFILEVIAQA